MGVMYEKLLSKNNKHCYNNILSNGGRVLNIVTRSNDFKSARQGSLKILDEISWNNGFYRKDIGYKVIQ